jgi:hypothetical protein
MDNESEIIMAIKRSLEQKVSAQLERNKNAGHPISRQQAINLVVDNQQREFKLKDVSCEEQGNEDMAEFFHKLSELLPGLMQEFGLR